MTAAGQFIAELHKERRSGKVSSETELHLKHVFRKFGWDTPASTLAAAVGRFDEYWAFNIRTDFRKTVRAMILVTMGE